MVELLFSIIFTIIIIVAVIAYFYKRHYRLKRMALRDQFEDMFR